MVKQTTGEREVRTVFEDFSDRARRVLFLTRKDAGAKGAAALEPAYLFEAIIREDQGEFARFPGALQPSGSAPLAPAQPFFSTEAASEILQKLERLLPPSATSIPDCVDMSVSAALAGTLETASKLAKNLHHKRVEPLHLLAALLSEETFAHIAEQVGISKDVVIAALPIAKQEP